MPWNIGLQPFTIERFYAFPFFPIGYDNHGVSSGEINKIIRANNWTNKNKGGFAFYKDSIVTEKDGQSIVFPFIIQKREMQTFHMTIPTGVPKQAWKKVKHRLSVNKNMAYFTAQDVFEEAQVPIFGQEECLDPKCYNKQASLHYTFYHVTIIKDGRPYKIILTFQGTAKFVEGQGFFGFNG